MLPCPAAGDRTHPYDLMPDEHLGTTRRHRGAACAAVVAIIGVAIIATPLANTTLPAIPGYMTAFGAAMIVINVLLAALLFSKGMIERRGDATRLGTAYFFVAVIFVPLVASFPGGLMPTPLIGTNVSSIWLWSFWHLGFGLFIIRYAWQARRPASRASLLWEAGIVLALVAALTVLSTSLVQYLPTTMADGHTIFSGWSGLLPVTALLVLSVALAMVWRLGARTPEDLWLTVAMVAAVFDVWLTYHGTDRFSVGWYMAKGSSLFTSLVVLITMLHEVTRLYSSVAKANLLLKGLARQDGLTGIGNRRHFDEACELEWRRSRREGHLVSLLMIDVDYFKNFNDRYGHLAGDVCLRTIAAVLQAIPGRPGDLAARFGGEEFAVLLPGSDANGAAELAERVHSALRTLAIPHADSPLGQVTVSIGLASAVAAPNTVATSLVLEADRGLYQAKNAGRNRTASTAQRDREAAETVLDRFMALASADSQVCDLKLAPAVADA